MFRIVFFRPRQIWIPTILGFLFLLFFFIAISIFVINNIYPFLAQNEPLGARVLIVEGWLSPKELDQAIDVFKRGAYERIVTTGGPISDWPMHSKYNNYAELAADYLAKHGVSRNLIVFVPSPASAQERTFLSAVTLRNAAHQLGISLDTIDLFSSGAHSRRSRLLFQMAFGSKIHVGILASKPVDFEPEVWWRTSSGAESIIFQSIGLLWVKCFFWPGSPGSQQELWGTP